VCLCMCAAVFTCSCNVHMPHLCMLGCGHVLYTCSKCNLWCIFYMLSWFLHWNCIKWKHVWVFSCLHVFFLMCKCVCCVIFLSNVSCWMLSNVFMVLLYVGVFHRAVRGWRVTEIGAHTIRIMEYKNGCTTSVNSAKCCRFPIKAHKL